VIILFAVNSGLMEDLPLDRCADFEEQLLRYVNSTHPDIAQSIMESKDLSDEVEGRLTQAVTDFKNSFSA
jgi:F-type H+-transporting ATPase subunit alpha